MTRQKARRGLSVAELIQNFRNLRMLVLMPPGREADEFVQHLHRMGCMVATQWPPPAARIEDADVVFVSIRPLIEGQATFVWDIDAPPAALIAIADYENPLMVEKTVTLQAQSTIGIPFRPFGVLMDVLLSVANFKREQRRLRQISKLSEKVRTVTQIEKAKAIVAETHNISLNEAYAILRQQAMNKRTTISEVVNSVVSAHEVLSLDLPKRV